MGFATAGIRWSGAPPYLRSAPAILAVKLNEQPHFVAAVGRRDGKLLIIDVPDAGWLTVEELKRDYHWQGESLHIAKSRLGLAVLYAHAYFRTALLLVIGCLMGIHFIGRWRRRALYARTGEVKCTALSRSATVAPIIVACIASGCSDVKMESSCRIASIEPKKFLITPSDHSSDTNGVHKMLRVTNQADWAISIRSVSATCGCTALAEPAVSMLGPGEAAEIPITFELPDRGVRASRITIEVEADTCRQVLVCDVKMRGETIQTPMLLRVPDTLSVRLDAFGNLDAVAKIRTYESAGTRRWIDSAATTSERLAIGLDEVQEIESFEPNIVERVYTYALVARDAAPSSTGTPLSRLVLQNAAKEPIAKIPVRLDAFQAFRVVPAALLVQADGADDNGVERILRIVDVNESFQSASYEVRPDVEWLQATLRSGEEGTNGHEWTVRVRIHMGAMPEASDRVGHIRITGVNAKGITFVRRIAVRVAPGDKRADADRD
jgi:hypothetical protein